MDDKIAPHVDEIIRALGSGEIKIDQNAVQKELTKLLEFKVPLNEAKRSLLKKYGFSDVPEVRKIADLQGGERNIELTARILDVNLKVVGIKGQERTIFMGTMADETGARSFTSWDDFGLKKGDVIKVTNAYTRMWQGTPEINFGPRSKLEKLDPRILDTSAVKDLGKPVVLSELNDGAPAIRTIFRIIECHKQEITTRNGQKTIITGIAADRTAKLPFTSWVFSPELIAGVTLDVENVYIKSWRGVPSINIGEFTTINKAEVAIDEEAVTQILEPRPIRLDRLTGRDGAFDVVIEGSIISVRPGSGIIIRCPQCNRVIQKNICRVHGVVEGIYDMRIKSILDDGTGALTVVLDADLTRNVAGISREKAKKAAAVNQSAVEDEIKKKLLGRTMWLRGNMTKGEYGITLVASDARLTEINTQAAALSLIGEIGEMISQTRELE